MVESTFIDYSVYFDSLILLLSDLLDVLSVISANIHILVTFVIFSFIILLLYYFLKKFI